MPNLSAAAMAVLMIIAPLPADAALPRALDASSIGVGAAAREWIWPVAAFRLERGYAAPAHRYGPGHRGVDVRPLDDAAVRAPADGVVAFLGMVAGRGILTIDHGDGFVTTFEPIDSALEEGTAVTQGERVGAVSRGGHTAPGALHFGVRYLGEYVNPMLLLGGVPRAVLLPCC
ncbi:M23 family metallopeptidase [Microbacterium sp. NPDC019599]|uniref:murein hydrolase activator EnvC family protein n=1 Tax=Microbacterium sp. NPDC019599 TaxID=3154690 RepID=UPI00340B6F74